MRPSLIQEKFKQVMSDRWFCQEYDREIAKATMEYYLALILLHGRWKTDPKTIELNERARRVCEQEMEV